MRANEGAVELEREFAATLIMKREEEDVIGLMGREMEDLYERMRRG
jgi:hypothetical protein